MAVLIFPPPHPGTPHEHTSAAGTGRNGGILSGDGADFSLHAWAGIGFPVSATAIWASGRRLRCRPPGRSCIENPIVTSDLPLPRNRHRRSDDRATVQQCHRHTQSGMLHGQFGDVDLHSPHHARGASESMTRQAHACGDSALHVGQPATLVAQRLRPQNLYALHLSFDFSDGIAPTPTTSQLRHPQNHLRTFPARTT